MTAAFNWLRTARDAAAKRLDAMGLPGRRDEYWKFTNPADLIAGNAPEVALFSHTDGAMFAELDRLKIVFVDGVFDADLSDPLLLEGIEIECLADASGGADHWAATTYGTLEASGQSPVPRPLAALNTKSAQDGVVIRVTGQPSKPVSLVYQRDTTNGDAMVHHVVRIEEGAALTLLENGPAAARFNSVLEIDVADRGRLDHIRTQGRDHQRCAATHMFARLGEESQFRSFTLTMHGTLTRNEIVVELTGENALAHVAGACTGDGGFHHDDTVFITHDAANCESRQVYKKVLCSGATGVFQGKILVQPDAQKTDGYQISQSLLLDDNCQFLAKPELEIYADDVACSHGSTSGAISEESLFYLRSRGIEKSEAQNLLVRAFLAEAIEEVEDSEIAELLNIRLDRWLARRGE